MSQKRKVNGLGIAEVAESRAVAKKAVFGTNRCHMWSMIAGVGVNLVIGFRNIKEKGLIIKDKVVITESEVILIVQIKGKCDLGQNILIFFCFCLDRLRVKQIGGIQGIHVNLCLRWVVSDLQYFTVPIFNQFLCIYLNSFQETGFHLAIGVR